MNRYEITKQVLLIGCIPALLVAWVVSHDGSMWGTAQPPSRPAWLGVETLEVDLSVAKQYRIRATSGLLVTRTFLGSPGARSGLMDGDVIRRWDGISVTNHRQFARLVRQARQNQKIRLIVERQEQPVLLAVRLGERPGNW